MELSRLAVSLILISILSFVRAQFDCAAFNISDLGATNALTQDGLIATAFKTSRGNFSLPVSVQVHDSNMVCLRSGRTRDTYRGVSVVVNYTCTGAPSECTGNPTLSQFEFGCFPDYLVWAPSVDGSSANIITTPPNGSLSTTLRTDCGVCVSPARSIFATITNIDQHCGCECWLLILYHIHHLSACNLLGPTCIASHYQHCFPAVYRFCAL